MNANKLQRLCLDSINELFDEEAYSELMEAEESERTEYQSQLRTFINDELSNN